VGSGQDTQVDREYEDSDNMKEQDKDNNRDIHIPEAVHRDAFGFLVQIADQIDRSTIIIVRCEATYPIKKPNIQETSEFF
jgi:hypothetical protein